MRQLLIGRLHKILHTLLASHRGRYDCDEGSNAPINRNIPKHRVVLPDKNIGFFLYWSVLMKKVVVWLVSAVAALACVGATAATSVDLFVKGRILPASCDLILTDGDTHDVGTILANDLRADLTTGFQGKSIGFAVYCNAPQLLAVRAVDGRAGTSLDNNPEFYGLGLDGAGNKIGQYRLALNSLSENGSGRTAIASGNGGASWSEYSFFSNSSMLAPGAKAGDGQWGPTPISALTGAFTIGTVIVAPANNLALDNEIKIDGQTTMELVYL